MVSPSRVGQCYPGGLARYYEGLSCTVYTCKDMSK